MYRYLFSTARAPADIPTRTADLISLFIGFGFNLIPITFSIGCKFILN
jgi:hypothetical protein